MDANEIIFKPTLDSFMQYLKSLEGLAIKYGKNGIDVIADTSSFRHLGKEQELIQGENRFNIISGGFKVFDYVLLSRQGPESA